MSLISVTVIVPAVGYIFNTILIFVKIESELKYFEKCMCNMCE